MLYYEVRTNCTARKNISAHLQSVLRSFAHSQSDGVSIDAHARSQPSAITLYLNGLNPRSPSLNSVYCVRETELDQQRYTKVGLHCNYGRHDIAACLSLCLCLVLHKVLRGEMKRVKRPIGFCDSCCMYSISIPSKPYVTVGDLENRQ